MLKRTVPALALLALAACRSDPVLAPSGAEAPVRAEAPRAGGDAVTRIYEAGLAFGATRRDVVRRLGRPDSAHTAPSPNRHDTTATDTVRYLRYRGLAYIFLQPAAAAHEFLLEVESTAPGRPDLGPLSIGRSTPADVRALLGEAGRTDTVADTLALWYTRPGESADDMVGLFHVRDTLRLVRWQPYVD
jgi:hypothetical protein